MPKQESLILERQFLPDVCRSRCGSVELAHNMAARGFLVSSTRCFFFLPAGRFVSWFIAGTGPAPVSRPEIRTISADTGPLVPHAGALVSGVNIKVSGSGVFW